MVKPENKGNSNFDSNILQAYKTHITMEIALSQV